MQTTGRFRVLRPSSQSRPEEQPRSTVRTVRRMSEAEVDDLVTGYRDGSSVRSLATRFGVHRTTVLCHLDRRNVERRPNVAKLVGASLEKATRLYVSGLSLAAVGKQMNVSARTVASALSDAGVVLRPRRGWPQQDRHSARP